MEAGETIEDACRREVKEETNLEIYDMRLLGVYSGPGRDPRGHVVSVAFRGVFFNLGANFSPATASSVREGGQRRHGHTWHA